MQIKVTARTHIEESGHIENPLANQIKFRLIGTPYDHINNLEMTLLILKDNVGLRYMWIFRSYNPTHY